MRSAFGMRVRMRTLAIYCRALNACVRVSCFDLRVNVVFIDLVTGPYIIHVHFVNAWIDITILMLPD